MESITKHNIKTRGVYLNETNPKQVIALVEFKEGDDPEAKITEYATSEQFKVRFQSSMFRDHVADVLIFAIHESQADLGEIEMSNFEAVDASFIKPLDFSPEK